MPLTFCKHAAYNDGPELKGLESCACVGSIPITRKKSLYLHLEEAFITLVITHPDTE